jgi:hypothetical protein
VAREYQQAAQWQPELSRAVATPRVCVVELAGVDHTFSRAAWRASVAEATLAWLRERFPDMANPGAVPRLRSMEVNRCIES